VHSFWGLKRTSCIIWLSLPLLVPCYIACYYQLLDSSKFLFYYTFNVGVAVNCFFICYGCITFDVMCSFSHVILTFYIIYWTGMWVICFAKWVVNLSLSWLIFQIPQVEQSPSICLKLFLDCKFTLSAAMRVLRYTVKYVYLAVNKSNRTAKYRIPGN
jgi:hypothetical protein